MRFIVVGRSSPTGRARSRSHPASRMDASAASSTSIRVRVQHAQGTDILSVSPLCTLRELHSAALALHASASSRLLASHPPHELDDDDWVTMVRNGHGRVLLSTSTPHGQPEPLAAPRGADAETTSPVTPTIATTTGDTEPGASELLLLGLDGDMLAAVSAALGLDGVLMMRATCRALAHSARRVLRSEAWRGGSLRWCTWDASGRMRRRAAGQHCPYCGPAPPAAAACGHGRGRPRPV